MPSPARPSSERGALEGAKEAQGIGFFGKLPSHGDFVATGLRRPVQDALDAWLRAGLQAVQQQGGDWEGRFRAMPPWRFIIEAGLWGPATLAGVMAPSRDRVGRSFPLVIATEIHDFQGDPVQLSRDETWFIATEGLAEMPGRTEFDIDGFTASLKRLRGLKPADPDRRPGDVSRLARSGSHWWRLDPEERRIRELHTNGVPQPRDFGRLVAESAASPDRQAEPPPANHRPVPMPREPMAVEPASLDLVLHHSVASHPGTRLALNGDAILAQEEPHLFAVIDGVGDSAIAAEAARAVARTLAETVPQDTIEALAQGIKGRLGRAHGLLQSAYFSSERETASASVVALAMLDRHFALSWAGDARCYILRDGMMRCLTRDHLEIGLRRKLARAIGLGGQLMPETMSAQLQQEDRFLLCSHPLVRVLTERGIAEILLSTGIDEAAAVLCQEALIANCRENVSAIVVEAKA